MFVIRDLVSDPELDGSETVSAAYAARNFPADRVEVTITVDSNVAVVVEENVYRVWMQIGSLVFYAKEVKVFVDSVHGI